MTALYHRNYRRAVVQEQREVYIRHGTKCVAKFPQGFPLFLVSVGSFLGLGRHDVGTLGDPFDRCLT